MKIDKDDLLITTLISGVIICSPLIAVYCIAEWIYNQTPWQKKKKLKMNAVQIRIEKWFFVKFGASINRKEYKWYIDFI